MTSDELIARIGSAATREVVPARAEIIRSTEVRDPVAATQPLSYTSPNMRMISEWDADSAVREAYLSSVVVYACVRTRAYAFSGCPLRAVLPGKDIADHDPNAPLAKLLGPAPGGPNPTMSARQLWANAITNRIVTGKIAWELEKPKRATGTDWEPVGLWPLVARAFEAVPSQGGSQLFDGFWYGKGGTGPWGTKIHLNPEQVFYSFIPSLNDSRQASSPLQSARYEIVADVLQGVYDVAFLRNDGRPAGVIVHQAFELAAERRAFEQQFEANHRGPANANRVAFAEYEPGADGPMAKAPIEWVQMGLSQRDTQALMARQDKVMRICMALSTPLSLLDASGRTFNNAGMEERNFWLDTMLPDLADMEDEINLKLAPRLGPHVAKFDTRHVVSLQPPARFLAIKLDEAVDRKIITPGEARSEMGFAQDFPAEDPTIGATMTEQAQLVTALAAAGWDAETIADILSIEPPAAAAEDTEPAPALEPAVLSPDTPTTMGAAIGLVRSLEELRHEATRAERRRALWRQADAQTRAQEGAWIKGLRRLFAKQRKTVLSRLESRKGRWAKAIEERADPNKPYGDVPYADPGYQEDGKKRYPIDTEAHAKAAWSYINMEKNAKLYSATNLAKVKARIMAALKKFGVDVSDRGLGALTETRQDEPNPDDVFDPAFWQQEMEGVVSGLYESLYATAGARAAGSVGVTFDLSNPKVQAAIEQRVSELAAQVTGTTYDAIKGVILSGVTSGASIPDIAAGIEAVFEQADATRAELIARTETLSASNDGALEGYRQAADSGYLDGMGKSWIGTDDERECPECEAVDGETVAFDEQFSSGDDAPPAHPDCRCTIGAEPLDDSGRGLSADQVRDVLRAVAAKALRAEELIA